MEITEEKQVNKINISKKEISQRRRNNARLYPLYDMVSNNLLLYYSIEFLFLTITKGVSASDLLRIGSFYHVMRIITQIPVIMITNFLGKKKSIILANMLIFAHTAVLITVPRSNKHNNSIFDFLNWI